MAAWLGTARAHVMKHPLYSPATPSSRTTARRTCARVRARLSGQGQGLRARVLGVLRLGPVLGQGLRARVSGQGQGQWSVVSGQWSVVSGQGQGRGLGFRVKGWG